MKTKKPHLKIIKSTPFGPVAIIWSLIEEKPLILQIILSTPDLSAEEQLKNTYRFINEESCRQIDEVAFKLERFLKGDEVHFSRDMIDWNKCSFFQKMVLNAEYNIPRGSVSTYQLLARYLGKEKGARAVGNALARNPFPIIIPCHRAIRSDGSLGGFQGGIDMKRALLEAEGIVFDDKGRVILEKFYYE